MTQTDPVRMAKCDDAATIAVLQGATLVGGVYLVLKGQMDGDHLIACMFYQSQLMEYMNNLLNVFTNLYKSSGAAAKVRVGCESRRCRYFRWQWRERTVHVHVTHLEPSPALTQLRIPAPLILSWSAHESRWGFDKPRSLRTQHWDDALTHSSAGV
jgi:hypothetical protein